MFERTIKQMTYLTKSKKIPGISYAFVSKGDVYSDVIGVKQLEPFVETLNQNTLYDMASLTKVICTTTMILKLIEAGKIEIDFPLKKYLPEFLDPQVTIKELLTHTSDINPFIPNRDKLNQEELKKAVLNLLSGDSRGKKVVYTDTGTVLLGFLIEEFYEKPVQQVFEEEVLRPLDMNVSGFKGFNMDTVAPTEITANRGLIKGTVHDPKAFVLGKHCGSAGLFSTVEDTLHFVQMMLQQGSYQNEVFLKKETISSLLRSHTLPSCQLRSLGWDLIPYENDFMLYHTGYTGTFLIIDINRQEAFVFLSNRVHPIDKREEYLKDRDELIKIYISERQARERML